MATTESSGSTDIVSVVDRALGEAADARRAWRSNFGSDSAGPGGPGGPGGQPWGTWTIDWARPASVDVPTFKARDRMFASRVGQSAIDIVGNETRTLQILRELGTETVLQGLGLDRDAPVLPSPGPSVETLIVKRPEEAEDDPPTILLLDPTLPRDFRPIRYTDALGDRHPELIHRFLRDGPGRSRQLGERHSAVAQLVGDAGMSGLAELIWITRPEVVLARQPEMEWLSSPSPSIEIECDQPTQLEKSSVGLFCRDSEGTLGVTACLHGTGPAGTSVTLGGLPATVRHADAVQDTVFIPLPDGFVIPPLARGLDGVRTKPAPSQGEPVTFDGRTSGLKSTVVSTHSPGLLWIDPTSQNKLQTPAASNHGDSGSALVDANDQIVGFAFRRTKYREPLEFAEWIWAANALASLGLTPM